MIKQRSFSLNKLKITIIKCFIFFSILCPIYYVKFGNAYYPEVSVPNILVLLLILCSITNKWIKNACNHRFVRYLLILLAGYNAAALYMNITCLKWFWEEINTSIAVLFFIILLLYENRIAFDRKFIRYFIGISVLAVIIGISMYFAGYNSISFMNCQFTLIPHDPDYYEKRFSWFFYHKSQYALFLLLIISLLNVYKSCFKSTVLFYGCNLLSFLGIILSHTWTAVICCFIIWTGCLIDHIRSRHVKIDYKKLSCLFPLLIAFLWILKRISRERSLWSLGKRIYIWPAGIKAILQNPAGVGNAFGNTATILIPEYNMEVNNCHNVFLNEMWRFSLPVGLLFTVIFISIVIYSLKKYFSFMNLGIWSALLISLSMDYSLLGGDFTIFFFYIYCIFFLPYFQEELITINQGNHSDAFM